MTAATILARPTTRKLAHGLFGREALHGLFGFGIASIAFVQAFASLSSVHLTTVWQVVFGIVGGVLGACVGAISSAGSDDRG